MKNPFKIFHLYQRLLCLLFMNALAGHAQEAGSLLIQIAGKQVQVDYQLPADRDGNGLPDAWEQQHFGHAGIDPNADPDGDGLTNFQEYQLGTNPAVYDDNTPTLTIVSGDNQFALAGQFNAEPFVVTVKNAAGTYPFANTPVTFTVQTGGGQLALANTGTPTVSIALTLTTDANGNAQVYFQQPLSSNTASTIQVLAGLAQVTITTANYGNGSGSGTGTGGGGGSGTGGGQDDADSNGVSDTWELQYFGHTGVDPTADGDADGISNLQEFINGTNPLVSDSGPKTPGYILINMGELIKVADNGTVLAKNNGAYSFWHSGRVVPIPSSISSAGTSVEGINGKGDILYFSYYPSFPEYYQADIWHSTSNTVSVISVGLGEGFSGITGMNNNYVFGYYVWFTYPFNSSRSGGIDGALWPVSGGLPVQVGDVTLSGESNVSGTRRIPMFVSDGGDIVAKVTAAGVVDPPQFIQLNGATLDFLPMSLNNNKTVIGQKRIPNNLLSEGDAGWWQDGAWHDLDSQFRIALAINNKGDILTADAGGVSAGSLFLRKGDNYETHSLDDYFPANWKVVIGSPAQEQSLQAWTPSINNDGLIGIYAMHQPVDSNGRAQGPVEHRAVLLVPAQLAVDADRDGTIKLSSEDASDSTSAENPYRFWVNDDIDLQAKSDAASAGDENPYSGTKNWDDNIINGLRDLEDFTRLNLYLGGLQDAVVSGQIKVGLKWKNSDSTTPSIKIWRNKSPNGGREYLTDVDVAAQHLTLRDPGLVKDAITYIIPTQYWTDVGLSASQPYDNLLFEGCSTGKGQLVMVLLNSNDTVIGEGASVWIELKHFNELYEHWTCGDTDLRDAAIASTPDHAYGSPFEYGPGFDGLSVPGAATYNDYVLFVHGWRMQPWERRAFAETAFKRMYHQGYKGKFGFFSWPTEWVDLDHAFITTTKNALSDPQHYDRSEVVARKSGAVPLHALLVSLNTRFGADHLHVFAHSMGNVVVSEALRAHQASTPLINAYIACQSAEVAHAYDQNAASNSDLSIIPNLYRYNPPNPRTNYEQLKEGDNYHKGLASRANSRFVSFANLNDQALGKWDLNQWMKPDDGWYPSDTAYSYVTSIVGNFFDTYREDPPGVTGSNLEHDIFWPAARFTILAHIVPARSRATGATMGIAGEFNPAAEVNLDAEAYQFGGGDYSHSAEFLSNFAERRTFYFQLLTTFRLSPDRLNAP